VVVRQAATDAKVAVKLRLDPDALAVLRVAADGWQTREQQRDCHLPEGRNTRASASCQPYPIHLPLAEEGGLLPYPIYG